MKAIFLEPSSANYDTTMQRLNIRLAWDSMQPSVGTFYGTRLHIGSYDQCLQAPWSSNTGLQMQYCLADVTIEPARAVTKEFGAFDTTDDYIRTTNKDGRPFHKQTFGVCLPAVCRPSSVARIFHHMHQLTHLPDGDIYVDPRDCQRAEELNKYSSGFLIFWTFVGVLLLASVCSTIFKDDMTKNTTLEMMSKSFCIKRNYNALFKVDTNDIKVMHGMRFIMAAMIVSIHEAFYTCLTPLANEIYRDDFFSSSLGLTLTRLEMAVDTFFAMSGLLLIRGLMMAPKKNVLYMLVKRYIRLMGPLAILVLFLVTGINDMDNGPFWKRLYRMESSVCKDTWWRSFLMVNNDTRTTCHVVSWYVSCDFQLAVLAVILFYIYRKSSFLGVTALVSVFTVYTLKLGWLVYSKELDIIPLRVKMFFELRNYTLINDTYTATYSRAGAYIVGMVMGYIVAYYNPLQHRNVISKKWSTIIVTSSFSVMVTMLGIGAIFQHRQYDALEAAVVVASNRVLWAVAVCCIIGVCEYGSAPLVTHFLSWSGFVPLSKISYCLYLVHPVILLLQKYSARAPATFGLYNMVMNIPGLLIAACALSFVVHLIFEAPLINVSNALLIDKSMMQNGTKVADYPNGKETQHNGNGHAKIK